VVIRWISFLGQPKQKVQETPISINKKVDIVVHACHPSYIGSLKSRIAVHVGPGIRGTPYSKNN
jgi:hypothetical protein